MGKGDMTETMSLNEAAQAMRDAMREAVKRHSVLYLIQGVLMVVAGLAALVYPLVSTVAIAFFLGWLLIATGVVQGISLLGAAKVPHFWLQLVSAALAIIVGFLFVRNPELGIETLILLLVVFFMIEGISKVIFSLTIRPFPNWGWVLASGLIGVALAVLLLSNPFAAMWVLGLLIGAMLVCEGAALAYLAWKVRKS